MAKVSIPYKQYSPLGWSEDTDTCHRCGKSRLKRVYAFRDKETTEVVYFGSGCMKTAAGYNLRAAEREKDRWRDEELGRRLKVNSEY
jgi:hypothetical protein